jgi:glycosyltransferase involved in cell wall biosynthesis
VTYRGEASPERVIETFSGYDFFLFPTLGENYGHVIFEALAGGCIPIISDQTPWQDLGEQKVGAVLSLGKKETFVSAIEDLNALSKEELAYKKQSANIYAKKKYEQSVKNTGYRQVFEL